MVCADPYAGRREPAALLCAGERNLDTEIPDRRGDAAGTGKGPDRVLGIAGVGVELGYHLIMETFQNEKYQIDMRYYHWVTHSLNWKEELQTQKPRLLSFSSCAQLRGLTWFMINNWHSGCVYGINE